MELKEVFEPVLNFIRNIQKKDKAIASKQAAKDRLKLVLMQDRASVSPDFFELMKQEIIDVIKKYIEIDEESLEVELTRGIEAGLEGPALYANIPIKNVKPVAPKNENDEEEAGDALSEEEAETVAEQILNQIEEVAKENIEEEKINENKKEVENEIKENKEDKIDIEENEDKKQDVEKEKKETKTPIAKTKKTTKATSKTSTKKTTSSKKDTKK